MNVQRRIMKVHNVHWFLVTSLAIHGLGCLAVDAASPPDRPPLRAADTSGLTIVFNGRPQPTAGASTASVMDACRELVHGNTAPFWITALVMELDAVFALSI